jgi:hypothetical protein
VDTSFIRQHFPITSAVAHEPARLRDSLHGSHAGTSSQCKGERTVGGGSGSTRRHWRLAGERQQLSGGARERSAGDGGGGPRQVVAQP